MICDIICKDPTLYGIMDASVVEEGSKHVLSGTVTVIDKGYVIKYKIGKSAIYDPISVFEAMDLDSNNVDKNRIISEIADHIMDRLLDNDPNTGSSCDFIFRSKRPFRFMSEDYSKRQKTVSDEFGFIASGNFGEKLEEKEIRS